MYRTRLLATALAAAALTAVTTAPALAEAPRIQAAGLGTAATTTSTATYAGDVTGRPWSGSATGSFSADDGSLPAVGVCEPASATLHVQDDKGHFYDLYSPGKVCGEYLPLGVMQRFTGRFAVYDASSKGLLKVNGAVDIRILNGQSDIYATS